MVAFSRLKLPLPDESSLCQVDIKLTNKLALCVYVWVHMSHVVHVEVGGQVWELVLFFHLVSLEDQNQVIRLTSTLM